MEGNMRKHHWDHVLLVISVLSVVLAFLYVACSGELDLGRKQTSESLAKLALRAYGEAERAYSHQRFLRHYGSYADEEETDYRGFYADPGLLIRARFLSKELLDHLPVDYTFQTSLTNYSTYAYYNYNNGTYSLSPMSTFTAVALPVITSPPGYLLTFAIREDRKLRAYLPDIEGENEWGEDDDYGARTWTVTD